MAKAKSSFYGINAILKERQDFGLTLSPPNPGRI